MAWATLSLTLVLTARVSAQDLGPHNINGQRCLSCHGTDNVDPGNVASTYLWGDFSTTIYSTSEGGALTVSADLTDQDPSFHSAACLVCHDGALAESGAMPGSELSHNHPVNIPYPVGASGYWPGTVTTSGVHFAPSHFDTVYGRPRFYVFGGKAYIECSTCHDPHNYSSAQVTFNGQTYVKPTAHFVRGWYDYFNPNSNSVSQFCRSCHYEMSNEADGLNIPTS